MDKRLKAALQWAVFAIIIIMIGIPITILILLNQN